MVTFSLCMIVKNESAVLGRCLDSITPLMDEIIIVDTGSTDNTKEIAAKYTDKIFDFEWVDDFSAARNFSFSKATCDYIYAPDADEYVDPHNFERFRRLKEELLPEIDIVQMHYLTKAEFNTVENLSDELRPKLFKRLRPFTWVDPIHETVQLAPIVYDSDICIDHLPQSMHHHRDFGVFKKNFASHGALSDRIGVMWAKELFKCGTLADYEDAFEYFCDVYYNNTNSTIHEEAGCVLARYFRMKKLVPEFFSIVLAHIFDNNVSNTCSEICYEIAMYYSELEAFDEAGIWFFRAVNNTSPILDIDVCKDACLALAKQYREMELFDEALMYEQKATEYELS